ncbi:MAG: transglycosylase domain-containing protein [Acidimicrobiia bacterium]
MRPETDAPERPRRPEDDWPTWQLTLLWLACLAVDGLLRTGRTVARSVATGARRTVATAGRARDAAAARRPALERALRDAARGSARWTGAAGRRSMAWTGDAAHRTWGTSRALAVSTRAWLVPQLHVLVAAGRRLDRRAWALARRAAGAARRWSGARRRGRTGRLARRVAVVGVVLVAALWAFSAPALRLAADVLADEVEDEGLPALEEASVVLGSNGETLTAMPGGPHRDVVALDEVPDHLVRMVVAAEDDRFWEHSGWDGAGIVRAALANATARGVRQGGSTISQQLAKRNFTDSERTVVRKAKELLYAVALEDRYTKRELLERYLNEVYLGSGAYGVAAAAREYFGVPLSELGKDQAAMIVGLIPSPGALDPRRDPEAARARRDLVLRIAADRGIVEPEEARLLQAAPLQVVPEPVRVTDPLLAAAVRRELLDEPALGADREERAATVATGGLRIETSIDARFQVAAMDAVRRGLERWPGLGGALAAVDPHTGAVRAIASATPPGVEGFDLATQGRRQPGSTFKALAAVAALEHGIDPDRRWEGDSPIEIEHAPGQRWEVENYGGRDHGSVDLPDALRSSVNTAFAEIAVEVGTPAIVDVAERLGVDVDAALGRPDQRGPSIALGALARGVSPLEMASAYGFLATGGAHAEARVVTRVVGSDGRVLVDRTAELRPVVDPAVTGEVRRMLQDVVDDGTGRAAELDGWQPAGKTGTSQGGADAWFVGTIPTLSVATWLGHPDAAQPVDGLTGGSAAAPIWRDFVAAAVDGTDPVPFPDAPPYVPDERWEPPDEPDEPDEQPSTRRRPERDDEVADTRPGRGRGRGRP